MTAPEAPRQQGDAENNGEKLRNEVLCRHDGRSF